MLIDKKIGGVWRRSKNFGSSTVAIDDMGIRLVQGNIQVNLQQREIVDIVRLAMKHPDPYLRDKIAKLPASVTKPTAASSSELLPKVPMPQHLMKRVTD